MSGTGGVPAVHGGEDVDGGQALRPAATLARMLIDLPAVIGPLTVRAAVARGGTAAAGSSAPRVGVEALAGIVVRGVTHDSRTVRPGDLYAALPGATVHGAAFVRQAVDAGAVAVLTDPVGAARIDAAADDDPARSGAPGPEGVPVVVTDDPRRDLAPVAAWLYGDPSRSLRLLGVTGTNGKTTTAFLVEAGLRAGGHRTGLLGTVQTKVAGSVLPSVRTTPESGDLQGLLAAMVERGVTAAVMEVSSHALAQHRADALWFTGAAFTNLTQDHLDFHPTMEEYFAAKARLFEPARVGASVVCVDDGWGRRLAAAVPGAVTYSIEGPADWRAVDVVLRPEGSTFRAEGPGGVRADVSLGLPGLFNVGNALAALALLAVADVPIEVAAAGLGSLAGVPGRMERVDTGQPFLALVDYAHTPDAVTTLLTTVRSLVKGRLIVVLGCGGDRDRGKRPLMGAAAARLADLSIFTDDNPRSEDPAEILASMVDGATRVSGPGAFRVVADRRAAIAEAVAAAGPADAVVVAGKGHETGQEQGRVVTPFDDREVLRAALRSAAGR